MGLRSGMEPLPVRVAILSDTHGKLDGRIIDVVAGCKLAVHGGDIGGTRVLDALSPLVDRVIAVAGNNDLPAKWPAGESEQLAALPLEVHEPLPGGLLVVIHGHQIPANGRHERLRRLFPHARAVVYGHSHRLLLDYDRTPWVLNPGAAGRSRTHGGPSCLVLVAGHREWTVETHRFLPPPPPKRPLKGRKNSIQHTVNKE